MERELGMPIAAVFERDGEEAFRAREAEVVGGLLESADGGAIALGGGSVLSERIRAALDRHIVVWLRADADEAWRRTPVRAGRSRSREKGRPFVCRGTAAALRGARRRRRALRSTAAGDRALPASGHSTALPRGQADLGPSRSGEYPVFVGSGLLDGGWWQRVGRPFMVSDTNVGPPLRRADRADRRPGRGSPARGRRRWPRPSACCGSWLAPG